MALVALVNANMIRPAIAPLGLEFVAEACREAGVEAQVIDLCFAGTPDRYLSRRLAELQPDLVGISLRNTDNCYLLSSHSFIPDLRETVATVRSVTAAPVVLGGAGFSVAPTAVLRATDADYGIAGDGEVLPHLLEALRGDRAMSQVPGLVWRDGDTVRANDPACNRVRSRPLRRDTIDLERYFAEGGQVGIETARGCDRRCIYCADPLAKGAVLRRRPAAAVADEIGNLLERGCDVYHTCDSEFNVSEEHARAVCAELIARDLGEHIRWYTYMTPRPFSEELAELMRRAGCRGIDFGADSGTDRMLRALGRDFTPEDIVRAVAACRAQGIAVMLDLLIGAPGESRDSARRTVELARECDPSCIGISLGVRVYPGTGVARCLPAAAPLESADGWWGQTTNNKGLLEPLFYLSPELGSPLEATDFLEDAIAGDRRFFFGGSGDDADYDYDDNQRLVDAIAAGARGAYWDILRGLRNA